MQRDECKVNINKNRGGFLQNPPALHTFLRYITSYHTHSNTDAGVIQSLSVHIGEKVDGHACVCMHVAHKILQMTVIKIEG